ncbi:hypothetical protein ABIE76_002904 [Sinorhizobium fredii]
MRVDQEDREDEERRDRSVEEGKQGARHQEGAKLLQIPKGLILAPVAVQRGAGSRTEDRRAELSGNLHRRPHQDHAADSVEYGLQNDRSDDQSGQHDQRVDRAAGQHPVRDLKQIDGYGEHQHVGGECENHHDHQVLLDRPKTGLEADGKIDWPEAFMEDPSASASTSATMAPAAGATLVGDAWLGLDRAAVAVDHHHARYRRLVLDFGPGLDGRLFEARFGFAGLLHRGRPAGIALRTGHDFRGVRVDGRQRGRPCLLGNLGRRRGTPFGCDGCGRHLTIGFLAGSCGRRAAKMVNHLVELLNSAIQNIFPAVDSAEQLLPGSLDIQAPRRGLRLVRNLVSTCRELLPGLIAVVGHRRLPRSDQASMLCMGSAFVVSRGGGA